jgi:hypothetical protein
VNGHEAQTILQKPVFGDPVHIYARDILRTIEVLRKETGKSRKELMRQQIDLSLYSDLLQDGAL